MNESQYREHALHSTVDQILSLENLPALHDSAVVKNAEYSFSLDKCLAVTRLVKAFFAATPAELGSVHGLDQINTHLSRVGAELTAYASDGNGAHLINAANYADQGVVPNLWAFAPHFHELKPTTATEIIRTRQHASETIKQLTDAKDKLVAEVQALSSEVASQNSTLGSLAAAVTQQKAEAAAAVAQVQLAYAESETKRVGAFDTKMTEFSTAFDAQDEGLRTKAETVLLALENSRTEAANLVQIVGNIAITGNYQKIAETETARADIWRRITVGIFIVAIAIATATFVRFWSEPITAEVALSIVVRLMYALAITAPAFYTARESARHRTNADRARQTELELAALGPFLEKLPEAKQIEIREALTKSYFGNQISPHIVESPTSAKDIKDGFVDIVNAVKPGK